MRDRKAGVLRAVAIAISIAVAADMALLGFTYSNLTAVRAETEALQSRINGLAADRDATRRVRSYDVGAQVALKAAGFALEEALAELEEAATPGVQLSSLEFDLLQGTGKAEVDAIASLELEKYLQGLGDGDGAAGWRVARIGAGPTSASGGVPLPPGVPGPLPAGMLGSVGAAKTVGLPRVSGGVAAELRWVGLSKTE